MTNPRAAYGRGARFLAKGTVVMVLLSAGAKADPDVAGPGQAALHIAFAGDTGTGTEQQSRVAQLIVDADAEGDFDWLVLLGDTVYDRRDPKLVDERVLIPSTSTW